MMLVLDYTTAAISPLSAAANASPGLVTVIKRTALAVAAPVFAVSLVAVLSVVNILGVRPGASGRSRAANASGSPRRCTASRSVDAVPGAKGS